MPANSDVYQLAEQWANEYLRLYGFPPNDVMAEPFIFLPCVQAALPMPMRDFCNAVALALKLINDQQAKQPPKPAPGRAPSPVRRFSATDPPRRVEHPDRLD